jgi:hypothetical protein
VRKTIQTMTEAEKKAYRYILYCALLEIRTIAWLGQSWKDRLIPSRWIQNRRRVQMAGSLADWLHNLALFSALDFERFDQTWFWKDYDRIVRRYGKPWPLDYHAFFEDRLKNQGKNEGPNNDRAAPGGV